MLPLSVITPVLNGSATIRRCLDSVIEQECPQVEHILIDGGSTDGTIDVIQHYATRYPHIRWISEQDSGQSDALNKGIDMSRGDILGVLNADDSYEPGVLKRILGLFEGTTEPALLVGNCNIWNSEHTLVEVNRPNRMRLQELLLGPAVHPYPFNPSAYFYHKSLHNIIGLYDVSDDFTMDLDFLLRAVQTADIHYYDEIWGNFFMRPGSKTVVDMENGHLTQRRDKKLEHFRRQLPFVQRQKTSLWYWFYNSRSFRSARYFWQRPDELHWRIRDRVYKLIGYAVPTTPE